MLFLYPCKSLRSFSVVAQFQQKEGDFFFSCYRKGSIVFPCFLSLSSSLKKRRDSEYCEWFSLSVVDVLCSDVGCSSEPSDVVWLWIWLAAYFKGGQRAKACCQLSDVKKPGWLKSPDRNLWVMGKDHTLCLTFCKISQYRCWRKNCMLMWK